MEDYHPGEVVLIMFPFTDRQRAKRRPALVLLDVGNADILVARITSQDICTDYDVGLTGWKQAGLLLPSVVHLHKLATLQKTLVERRLGALTPKDLSEVKAKLRQIMAD